MSLNDYVQSAETVHYQNGESLANSWLAVTDSRLVVLKQSSDRSSVLDIAIDRIDEIQYQFKSRQWWYIGGAAVVFILWLTVMLTGDQLEALQPLPAKVTVTIAPLAIAASLLYLGFQSSEELVVSTPSGSVSFEGENLEPIAHAIRGAAG